MLDDVTKKPLPFLLLIAGLLSLTACQPAEAPTAAGDAAPSPTLTRRVERPGETGSQEQPLASSPRPLSPNPQLPTSSPQPADPNPIPVQGGEVVVGGLGRPDTLNPLLTETEVGRALTPLLFDSLLAHNPDSGALEPHLAEAWTVADDNQAITFTLRSDARWHDGQPVTAGDVAFTIESARDPILDSLYGPQLSHVTAAYAPDDRTVVITLDESHCPSLTVLGELPILPQHLLANSEPSGMPPGSGPFLLINWTPAGEVLLARNDNYWGGAPYLDTLTYHPFETVTDLAHALEADQIDVALMPAGRPPPQPNPSLNSETYHYPASEFLFVAFNNDHSVLGDPKVRLALSMAVDREQLLDQALNGMGELIAGSFPATHWAADPALRPPAYDPAGARQLLAEAGWTDADGDGWLDRDGERLRLPVRTNGGNQLREDVATLVAGYYRAIGVDASVELVVWGAVVDDLFTHDFEVIVFSWPLGVEPDQSRLWLSTEDEIGRGYNFASFADDQVDRLLGEALAIPGCDPGRRAELYRQLQHVLAQERPYDFLLIPYATVLTHPGIQGLAAGPFANPMESAAAWYIVP